MLEDRVVGGRLLGIDPASRIEGVQRQPGCAQPQYPPGTAAGNAEQRHFRFGYPLDALGHETQRAVKSRQPFGIGGDKVETGNGVERHHGDTAPRALVKIA